MMFVFGPITICLPTVLAATWTIDRIRSIPRRGHGLRCGAATRAAEEQNVSIQHCRLAVAKDPLPAPLNLMQFSLSPLFLTG